MNTFNELGLPDSLTQSLTRIGLIKPTEIQAQTIPLALEGNDILGCTNRYRKNNGLYIAVGKSLA